MFDILKRLSFKSKNTDRKDDPEKQQRESALAVTDSYISRIMGSFESYNPDLLVQRKGADVYKRMLRDDQVKAAFMMKLSIIISRSMVFDVKNDDQIEVAEFFERNITDLIIGTWAKAMKTVLMGKAWGYSVTEKIFKPAVVDGKQRWIIAKLKQKPWHSFSFVTDKYGNLTKILQDQDTVLKQMPPDKFIRYVNMPEMDDIWGESDLKAAYRPYWEKDITQKFWNIYTERVAGGFVMGTPNENIGNMSSGEVDNFKKTLSNISGTSGLIGPAGYDISIEVPRDNSSFQNKVDKHDKQIARAVLMPNLLGFTEQGNVGSYAQSETVLDMFMMLVTEEGDYLIDLLNEELFSQLAYWNFGVTDYPRAKFVPYTTEQKRAIAKIWIEAVKEGTVTNTIEDELYTRELLLYPVPEKEDLEEARKANAVIETVETEPVEKPESKDSKSDDTKIDNKEYKPLDQTLKLQIEHSTTAPTKLDHVEPVVKEPVKNVDYESPQFTDRVDFKALETKLDTVESDFSTGLASGVDSLVAETTKGIEAYYLKNKKNIKEKTVEKENVVKALNSSISSKTKSKINRVASASLKSTYSIGRKAAQKAVNSALKDAPNEIKDKIQQNVLFTEQRACRVSEWSAMHFVDGISLIAAEEWFSSQAFTITGDLTDAVINAAASAMMEGIVSELSLRQVISNMEALLPTLVGTTDKAERARIETIVRTNMSTIFTQAQLAFYADPALNGFVNGMEYSAILDNRTTEVCNRLDGAKYAMDNPIWGHITPPNHFQCRSVLIPVTIIDDWRSSSRKYGQGQLPHAGFGKNGFPTKYLTEGAK